METKLLKYVDCKAADGDCNTLEFAKVYSMDHQAVVGMLKTLESTERLCSDVKTFSKLELTTEGEDIANFGSYEYKLFNAVPPEGISKEHLMKSANDKIGFAKAMSNKWIVLAERDGRQLVVRNVDAVVDQVRLDLSNLELLAKADGKSAVNDYKKRKLLKDVTVKYFTVRRGPQFSTDIGETGAVAAITEEMVRRGDELDAIRFKRFNVAGGIRSTPANLHPLLKMRKEYARILIEMGFREMPTNNYVESSFWNFDALFQPQDHAARDAHDTFFVQEPRTADGFPSEYLHRVQQVHSDGGYGSQGYRGVWQRSEAEKNIMRTHTTAVSARMLYKLAQAEEFEPVKYYSIDRVFRNESLDATHLAEFHQVEGLVADRGITLGSLKTVIRDFFGRLGIGRVRFKPAYNPYTEPSMEIFGFHPGLDRWIEVGNSGMFRPEMLLPMGLPEDVNVIAWGLSLERPTMIKYGIDNIRELMGPKLDLETVFANPACRLDR